MLPPTLALSWTVSGQTRIGVKAMPADDLPEKKAHQIIGY
jgi:hypothetical protein